MFKDLRLCENTGMSMNVCGQLYGIFVGAKYVCVLQVIM